MQRTGFDMNLPPLHSIVLSNFPQMFLEVYIMQSFYYHYKYPVPSHITIYILSFYLDLIFNIFHLHLIIVLNFTKLFSCCCFNFESSQACHYEASQTPKGGGSCLSSKSYKLSSLQYSQLCYWKFRPVKAILNLVCLYQLVSVHLECFENFISLVANDIIFTTVWPACSLSLCLLTLI